MKEIKLRARLSAYSKVDAVSCNDTIQEATRCDIDQMFGDPCNDNCDIVIPTKSNEVSKADIDALFA